MDEFDEDEDVQIDIDGVPFAAEKDFLEKYGTAFTLSYGENKGSGPDRQPGLISRGCSGRVRQSLLPWPCHREVLP